MGQQQSKSNEITATFTITSPSLQKDLKKVSEDTKLGYMNLGGGKWHEHKMSRICPYIKEWNIVKGLILDKNEQPRILKQICNINFSLLQQLTLRNNRVESIQIIDRIYFPSLQRIWFCNNYIISILPLRKCNLPNLRHISLRSITLQLSFIILCELDSPYLQQILVQLENKSFLNISPLLKLQTKNICRLMLQKSNRRLEQKVWSAMKRKYEQLNNETQECS